MRILFLDTASNPHALALCTEEKTLALKEIKQHGDQDIVPAIEAALEEGKMTYEDLTHLACAIGPGGFTSLRIGVTAVNTLAHALGLPAAGVHLSALRGTRVKNVVGAVRERPLQRTPSPFLWLHSTRKTQLFVKGFGADGKTTPCTLMDLDDAVSLQGEYVGELIPEHQEALKNCAPMPEEKLASLKQALPQFLSGLTYSKQQLIPWYGREG